MSHTRSRESFSSRERCRRQLPPESVQSCTRPSASQRYKVECHFDVKCRLVSLVRYRRADRSLLTHTPRKMLCIRKCIVIFFISCCGYSASFTPPADCWRRIRYPVGCVSNAKRALRRGPPIRTSLSLLLSRNATDFEEISSDGAIIEDPILLSVDVLAILLSCQLMGFMDAMSAPNFWTSGGFLQPIPMIPSSLGLLVQRVSMMSISWISAGVLSRGFRRGAYASDRALVVSTGLLCLTYVLFRVGLAAVLSGQDDSVVDAIDLARQCYYPLVINAAFRYIYAIKNR